MAIVTLTVESTRPFSLGKKHDPYMVLPHGGTGPFSCANCNAFSNQGGINRCSRGEFVDFNGSDVLPDENGHPLNDPTRACSDWFWPR